GYNQQDNTTQSSSVDQSGDNTDDNQNSETGASNNSQRGSDQGEQNEQGQNHAESNKQNANGDQQQKRPNKSAAKQQQPGPNGDTPSNHNGQQLQQTHAQQAQQPKQKTNAKAGLPQGDQPPLPSRMTEAVDTFDQQGDTPEIEATPGAQSHIKGQGGNTDRTTLLMEQWLDQIEGDPAILLKSQFNREAQRQLQQTGSLPNDPRPW
ncbi:MAG: hypothetical protein MI754_11350, partial [Chromatiales bacterium]|nr:hypothetical protein [Chromatiales bacterium]